MLAAAMGKPTPSWPRLALFSTLMGSLFMSSSVAFTTSGLPSVDLILNKYADANAMKLADSLDGLALEIQKDTSLVHSLVTTLLNQADECLELIREVDDTHEIGENHGIASHRILLTTDLFKDVASLKTAAKKLKKSNNRNMIDLNLLSAEFASLRNFTLANTGTIFALDFSVNVGVDQVQNIIADISSEVASDAAALDSMKVTVGNFLFNVDSISTTVDSQVAFVDSASLAVNGLISTVASTEASVKTLSSNELASSKKIATIQQEVSTNEAVIKTLTSTSSQTTTASTNLVEMVTESSEKLQCISSLGDQKNEFFFRGCNVHVRNGLGSTATSNGGGNLIVGSNTVGNCDTNGGICLRDGSHNLVLGDQSKYRSYGGIVVGYNNEILQPYVTVTGGSENVASGLFSAIPGGAFNVASAQYSAVTGGAYNIASGESAVVGGGQGNKALHAESTVVGMDSVESTANKGVFPY